MRRTFRFYKTEKNEWYIDLPEWKGDVAELQMVEGADTMLDIISGNGKECKIDMSDEVIEGAEVLSLIRARDPQLSSGGDYILERYEAKIIHHPVWLCGVTEFVFGQLPERIWFKKADAGC